MRSWVADGFRFPNIEVRVTMINGDYLGNTFIIYKYLPNRFVVHIKPGSAPVIPILESVIFSSVKPGPAF